MNAIESKYFQIGTIKKTKGLKGEVQLYFEVENPEAYENLESVFIEINNKPVPFFIDTLRMQEPVAYLYLEGVEHIDQATPLVNKKVYIYKKNKPKESKAFKVKDLVGYFVEDTQLGELAIINSIEEMPQQTMASMVYQNKEVLFPINEQFVKSIDQAAKKIMVELPDGLLAIYLS